MASLLDELKNILNEELSIYRQLIPISEAKTKIIVDNDLEALSDITGKEQAAVDRILSLEHKREAVMNDIRIVINRKTGDFNLRTLIGLLGKQPSEQKALSILRDELNDAVQRLAYVNNRNQSLIQQSLEMIEFNMNIIQSTRTIMADNTSTKRASKYEAQASGPSLFDTKQ